MDGVETFKTWDEAEEKAQWYREHALASNRGDVFRVMFSNEEFWVEQDVGPDFYAK